MKTKNLDKAYKTLAELTVEDIKDKIKTGPTKAYKTGNLYRSIASTVKPIQGGESISISMNYYGEYVNDGTFDIEPPRRFIEKGLQDADNKIDLSLIHI